MKSIPKLLILICLFSSCYASKNDHKVTLVSYNDLVVGAAQTEIYKPILQDKKIAIVANHTSVVGDMHTVDLMINEGLNIVKVFSPEHGFRGNKSDGALIENQKDKKTGLPIISLYGNHKKPTKEDLNDIDIVIFDIQDVGVRFYTYLSTLTYVMEACAENDISVLVFDRPNPNGFYVDGPIMKDQYKSFVGLHPVPIVHGMTPGEFALMINGEKWLNEKLSCDLNVITVKDYDHNQSMELPIKPSPNLPNYLSVLLYPSIALFEGTVVSIGRGTSFPFQVIGHPNYHNQNFAFTPVSIPGVSKYPPLQDQECYGIDLRNIKVEDILNKGELELKWILNFYNRIGSETDFFSAYFEKLVGQDLLREQIKSGINESKIRKSWKADLDKYKKIRAKYLLYPDFE